MYEKEDITWATFLREIIYYTANMRDVPFHSLASCFNFLFAQYKHGIFSSPIITFLRDSEWFSVLLGRRY